MINEMTAEEAVKQIKENCYFASISEKTKEALDKAIKALEQSSFINKPCISEGVCREDKIQVLEKIRAEIERKAYSGQWSDATMYGMLKAVAVIDKYRAENEGGE